ncbi:MAG: hypothetical protein ACTHLW_02810 [Verrucomicrobiota bacterium]
MSLQPEARQLSPEEIQAYISSLNEKLEEATEALVSFEKQSADQVMQGLAEINRTIHQLSHSCIHEM